MKARIVIGSGFGDEGKGLLVDYLCAFQGAGMVVRFNGGSQAGHTVLTPDGIRHVHSHFGAGTLWGTPTFLSQFFICNPILALDELRDLLAKGVRPVLYAHPNCLVTSFADMMINQRLEDKRGSARHGSVGIGINETIERSNLAHLKITMSDLWNEASLEDRLAEICGKYAEFRCGSKIEKPEAMIEEFIRRCKSFASFVQPLGIAQCKDPVFEGAQGLLLDQNHPIYYPHVTRSNTGMRNVRILCLQAGIPEADREIYYVSRTYLTRHGAGPLPGEDPKLSYYDDTNAEHPYQGKLRFAPLDVEGLRRRCEDDAQGEPFKLVLTHCDQKRAPCEADLYSYGPTRNDVKIGERMRKIG